MKCSVCKTKLIKAHGEKRYETLSDHVCDPNGTPILRTYFVCGNDKCSTYRNSFFGIDGDFYSTSYPHKFIREDSAAIGSISRSISFDCKKTKFGFFTTKTKKLQIEIGWYRFRDIPIFPSIFHINLNTYTTPTTYSPHTLFWFRTSIIQAISSVKSRYNRKTNRDGKW